MFRKPTKIYNLFIFMKKVQISNKKAMFSIVEGMTTTGKACLILLLNEYRLSKEAFSFVREAVSLGGGFSFMQKGRPAYMKIDLATLNSILLNLPIDSWVKPEVKETKADLKNTKKVVKKEHEAKQTAKADLLASLPAEKLAILKAFMPELFA
jgi:hypothetical protein